MKSTDSRPPFFSGIAFNHFLTINATFIALIAGILIFIHQESEKHANKEVARALSKVEIMISSSMETRYRDLHQLGRAIVKDSRIFPMVEARRSADLLDLSDELEKRYTLDRIIFLERTGHILSNLQFPGSTGRNMASRSTLVQKALKGDPSQGFMRSKGQLLQIIAQPILHNATRDKIIGVLLIARHHAPDLESEIRTLTGWKVKHSLWNAPKKQWQSYGANGEDEDASLLEVFPNAEDFLTPLRFDINNPRERLHLLGFPLKQYQGQLLGSLLVFIQHSELVETFEILTRKIFLAGLFFCVVGSIIFLWITRRLNQPVSEILQQCEAIRKGHYELASPTKRKDEFGILANSIHEMGLDLKEKADLEHFFSSISFDTLDVVPPEGDQLMEEYNMADDSQLPKGLLFADRYLLQQFLGEGGSGMVYGATDSFLQEDVAIKVFEGWEGSETKLAPFKQEVVMMRKISHPNVTRLHEFGTYDGVHYVVMEWVKGGHLRSFLKNHGSLSPKNTLILFRQICQALDQAHSFGIIHLDIKPENVLIGQDGRIKLNDFGISRWFTSPSEILNHSGTPGYMSPEQIQGGQLSPASDIFSLGVMLYECLSGRLPEPNDKSDLTFPISTDEDPSGNLRSLLEDMLEPTPEERLQKVSDIDRRIRDVLSVMKDN